MSNYEATVGIAAFRGLMQYGEGINTDMRYAVDAKNLDTQGGVLQPVAACQLLAPSLPSPIETLARLYRRWHTGSESKEILVAASDGQLYYMVPTSTEWTQLPLPEGVTAYQSNVWSCAAYEINPEGSAASVDVLLLSNAYDGMVMVRGDTLTVAAVPTPKKFGTIERYAERIWGGAILDDPDMLVYSAPFDPTDWEANAEIPEDGAGDLNQPSWDGDSFTTLKAFGSQLIAFKKTRVWRILGTDPGEYTFKEQYGGGAPYAGTVAIDNERILMLTDKGPQAYDGLSASPWQQEYCRDIWARLNIKAMDGARSILWHKRYFCAVPLDDSEVNNAVIVYDPTDGTWLVRDDVCVEQFLGTEERLYFTSATTPGRVWEWVENGWESGICTTAATKWVTPWTDLGAKNVQKGGFDVYLMCEVLDKPVTLRVTIQTEKKTKTKQYTVSPANASDLRSGRGYKQKRMHFGGTGRRFRLCIETSENSPPWRIVGGLLVVAETDPD